jgi:hypothetical protein
VIAMSFLRRTGAAVPARLSVRLTLAFAMVVLASAVAGAQEGLPTEIVEACVAELPSAMAEDVEPGSLSGDGPAGSWRIYPGEMDGVEPLEAVLVVLPKNRRGEVHFFAQREDGRLLHKKISLKGGALTSAAVNYEVYAPGKALLHVQGGEAGQVLSWWDGRKLAKIWEVGRQREQEQNWFELDDLDDDGIREIITYVRRETDVFRDDEFLDAAAGGHDRTLSSDQVDALAVYHLDDGNWRKSRELLEDLRS